MSHPSKVKGSGFERAMVKELNEAGLGAKRVVLSGAHPDHPDDVVFKVGGLEWRGECKIRGEGAFRTLYKWLPVDGCLFLRASWCEPLVVMSAARFCGMARELNY